MPYYQPAFCCALIIWYCAYMPSSVYLERIMLSIHMSRIGSSVYTSAINWHSCMWSLCKHLQSVVHYLSRIMIREYPLQGRHMWALDVMSLLSLYNSTGIFVTGVCKSWRGTYHMDQCGYLVWSNAATVWLGLIWLLLQGLCKIQGGWNLPSPPELLNTEAYQTSLSCFWKTYRSLLWPISP